MDNKRILIAETSVEFSESLREILSPAYAVQICNSGLSVMSLLEEFDPDVLVMDLALPGIDGISLLKQISVLPTRPCILLTTCFMSRYVETAISGLGVDLVILKPCMVEILAERIEDLTQAQEPQVVMPLRSRPTVSAMLMDLNLPAKRRGFTYLEQAIKLHMERPTRALTKVIYPQIAKEHGGKSEAVERAIRQMIRETWKSRDDRVWRMYFCAGREGVIPCPTNGEFISRIAECYRQVREEQA
jgi:two-component system response regulator (stage 0 sporulation protein A)